MEPQAVGGAWPISGGGESERRWRYGLRHRQGVSLKHRPNNTNSVHATKSVSVSASENTSEMTELRTGGGGGVDKGGTAIWFNASSLLKKGGAGGRVSRIMETKKNTEGFYY